LKQPKIIMEGIEATRLSGAKETSPGHAGLNAARIARTASDLATDDQCPQASLSQVTFCPHVWQQYEAQQIILMAEPPLCPRLAGMASDPGKLLAQGHLTENERESPRDASGG
jgi:hypothetical protein